MSIYWMKTADVYPNARYDETAFMAFDPEVRFPAFHMVRGTRPSATSTRSKAGFNLAYGNGP